MLLDSGGDLIHGTLLSNLRLVNINYYQRNLTQMTSTLDDYEEGLQIMQMVLLKQPCLEQVFKSRKYVAMVMVTFCIKCYRFKC